MKRRRTDALKTIYDTNGGLDLWVLSWRIPGIAYKDDLDRDKASKVGFVSDAFPFAVDVNLRCRRGEVIYPSRTRRLRKNRREQHCGTR